MRPFAEIEDELVFFVLLSLPISSSFSEEFALGVKAAPSDLSDEDDDDNATISSAREVVMLLYDIDMDSTLPSLKPKESRKQKAMTMVLVVAAGLCGLCLGVGAFWEHL